MAMIAMTTNSSIRVKALLRRLAAERDENTGRGSFRRMPGGSGPGGRTVGPARTREKTRAGRAPGAGAAYAARRAGLPALGSYRPPDAFPRSPAVAYCPGVWPITAAAPRR